MPSGLNTSLYPNWLEIDLSIVERNLRNVRRIIGVEVMAVVKADAYGYGIVPVAKAAQRAGAAAFGVARVDEALALRRAGIALPVLVLGMIPQEQIPLCIAHSITLPAHSFEVVEIFNGHAAAVDIPLHVHIKVDTGMGRLGVFPEEALALAQRVLSLPCLRLDGIFSHLANADRQDHPGVHRQIERFNQAVNALHAAGIYLRWVHLANSAAALGYPQARFNIVRGAQFLVGHNAFSDRPLHPEIGRILHAWKARLTDCLHLSAGERIPELGLAAPEAGYYGLISVGYGDGYWRLPGSQVLIGGKRQPVVGLPGFDCMAVRLDRAYLAGTEVLLVGAQGNECITIEDLAKWWHTGPGKISSVIPAHVPRVYRRIPL